MASDTTPQCHFLKLPLELRLQIYALLLLLPPYSRHSIRPVRIHAAVLRASRQIHAEAWPLLYTKNTFLAHPSLLTSFPRLRENYPPVKEQAAVSRIRRFRLLIRLDCDVLFTREEAARALSHMDEVVVDVSQAVFLGAGRENLRVLEGVRGVGRANPGEHDWLRGVRGLADGDDGGGQGARCRVRRWVTVTYASNMPGAREEAGVLHKRHSGRKTNTRHLIQVVLLEQV